MTDDSKKCAVGCGCLILLAPVALGLLAIFAACVCVALRILTT